MIETFGLVDEFHAHLAIKIDREVEEFIKATNEEDELQIILRGHIYIEHEIEKMVRNHLVEPSAILGGRNRVPYNNKLKLAVALGVLPKDKKSPYDKLGGLRNKYAHKLNYKMTESDFRELVDSMDKDIKGDVYEKEWNEEREMSDEKRNLLKIKRAILSLWVYASRLVYKTSVDEYLKKVDEIELRYMGPNNTRTKEECEAECMELFKKLRNDVGVEEDSIWIS